eukprot:g148.t1
MTNYEQNWNEKISEIVALRSILGTDFRLTGGGGLSNQQYNTSGDFIELLELPVPDPPISLFCQAVVYVEIPPEGIELTFIASSSSSSSSSQSSNSVLIHHLPALRLDLELSPEYPEEQEAKFHLSCCWLSQKQLNWIEDELNRIWMEQPGTQICFSWIDWLHTELLDGLGMTNPGAKMVLDPSRSLHVDSRSQPGTEMTPVRQIFTNLVEYNNIQTRLCFENESWVCPVCMNEDLGSKFVLFQECGDYFCKQCFSQYCSLKIKDGDVDFACPGPGCKTPVLPAMLKQYISSTEFDRWENLLLKRTLETMEDIKYCPKCSTACIEETGQFSQCPKCFFAFCTKCYTKWHPGSDCISLEDKLKELGIDTIEDKTLEEDKLRLIRELENQALSLDVIYKESQPCPSCGMAIQKTGGCNHMFCIYCNTHFCHKCRQPIYDGYNHFGAGNCILFDDEVIAEWEREMNALGAEASDEEDEEDEDEDDEVVAARREAVVVRRMMRCGVCRAVNFKLDKNNHIRCQVCSANNCFLCGQVLPKKNAITHFQSGRCEQHTNL